MANKISVLLTLDPELVARLDAIAAAAEIPRSRSWLVRRIVREWLASTPFEEAAARKMADADDE